LVYSQLQRIYRFHSSPVSTISANIYDESGKVVTTEGTLVEGVLDTTKIAIGKFSVKIVVKGTENQEENDQELAMVYKFALVPNLEIEENPDRQTVRLGDTALANIAKRIYAYKTADESENAIVYGAVAVGGSDAPLYTAEYQESLDLTTSDFNITAKMSEKHNELSLSIDKGVLTISSESTDLNLNITTDIILSCDGVEVATIPVSIGHKYKVTEEMVDKTFIARQDIDLHLEDILSIEDGNKTPDLVSIVVEDGSAYFITNIESDEIINIYLDNVSKPLNDKTIVFRFAIGDIQYTYTMSGVTLTPYVPKTKDLTDTIYTGEIFNLSKDMFVEEVEGGYQVNDSISTIVVKSISYKDYDGVVGNVTNNQIYKDNAFVDCNIELNDFVGKDKTVDIVYAISYANGEVYDHATSIKVLNRLQIDVQYPTSEDLITNESITIENFEDAKMYAGATIEDIRQTYTLSRKPYEAIAINTNTNITLDLLTDDTLLDMTRVEILDNLNNEPTKVELAGHTRNFSYIDNVLKVLKSLGEKNCRCWRHRCSYLN